MVIGETFAWAHLPKTGGNATSAMFDLFPELVVFSDPLPSHVKHTRFAQRRDQVAGKRLLMSLRRLPSWMLSLFSFANQRGLHPNYEPLPMRSPHEMASSREGDRMLLQYLEGGALEIDRWFRMESLAEDFLDFVSELVEVGEERRRAVLEMGRVNKLTYDDEVGHWFDERRIALMYGANPLWARLEAELYGDLLGARPLESEPAGGERGRLRRLLRA